MPLSLSLGGWHGFRQIPQQKEFHWTKDLYCKNGTWVSAFHMETLCWPYGAANKVHKIEVRLLAQLLLHRLWISASTLSKLGQFSVHTNGLSLQRLRVTLVHVGQCWPLWGGDEVSSRLHEVSATTEQVWASVSASPSMTRGVRVDLRSSAVI